MAQSTTSPVRPPQTLYLVERIAWTGPRQQPLQLVRSHEWLGTYATLAEAEAEYTRSHDAEHPVCCAVAIIEWTCAAGEPLLRQGNYALRNCNLAACERLVRAESRPVPRVSRGFGSLLEPGEWSALTGPAWLDAVRSTR